MKRKRREKRGRSSRQPVEKKQKSQGQCDFLEPNKSRSEGTFRPQKLWAA
jgi:hypothetical protein